MRRISNVETGDTPLKIKGWGGGQCYLLTPGLVRGASMGPPGEHVMDSLHLECRALEPHSCLGKVKWPRAAWSSEWGKFQ